MADHVGSRIRSHREAQGLQAQDLAGRIGLDATALSKIENGKRAVKAEELARIADALRVSPLALLEEAPLLSRLPMAARRAGASITSGRAYAQLLSLTELHVVLAEAGLPTSPHLADVQDVSTLPWLEKADALAAWATTRLTVDARGDLRLAALADCIEQELRVDVIVDEFPDDPLSGAALTDHAFPLLFVNSTHARPRALFTLAHELGHVLLGHIDEGIALDRELASTTEVERTANAFAAMFLMPEQSIAAALDRMGRRTATIVYLAHAFGVSFQTIVYRLHNMREIDAAGRDRLTAFNWQHELARLSARPEAAQLSRAEIGQLQSRGARRPARRLPGLLVSRAIEGFRKGHIGVRPLAALLGENAEDLLERLADPEAFEREHLLLNGTDDLKGAALLESSEEAFAGSPV
jgi:Zn-dependent peptidase ImmA (M78 family)/transcriptional regulator with XRE-family HTH domain